MISLIMIIFMISTSVIMDAEKMNGHGWKNNRATRIFCTFLACSLSRQESEITACISTATTTVHSFLAHWLTESTNPDLVPQRVCPRTPRLYYTTRAG